ncbi:MAG: NAD(P)/FAD-dependent oxidoreductase [Vicinamibacterales bacterium]
MPADIVIVGGGPAGSSCAWALRRGGADVVVIDRAHFPRDKICAGWITPPVVRALELDLDDYCARGLTLQPIRGFRTSVVDGPPVETMYREPVSYAIRRCEFDDYLLTRSGARVLMNTPVKTIERRGDRWILNGEIEARVLVGAGGHFCPIARHVGRTYRDGGLVVAQELEIPLPPDASCRVAEESPELYFCGDLEGYGWCVRKGAHLNVGLGRRDDREFPAQVRAFTDWLHATGRIPDAATTTKWRGHAYLLAGSVTTPRVLDGLMLIGDSAGLAYPESGEGIRPAIESGIAAAGTLQAARGTSAADLQPYEAYLAERTPPASLADRLPPALTRPVGRWLLGSPTFTRRVVLDRWFLRSAA